METTSIFYVNSMGFMAQWKGTIIERAENSISIRFSKSKALKFNLKDLDIDFVLVTKISVKDLGVCISKASEAVQFDDKLKEIILKATKDNVKYLWRNGGWEV